MGDMKFRDFADAGQQLAPLVAELIARLVCDQPTAELVLIAIAPGGVPVATAVVATGLLPEIPLHVFVREAGAELPCDVGGRTVIAIDDGVETGTAARAVGALLRDAGAVRTVLAVPVCPREIEVEMRLAFDDVIAIDWPMERRPLHEHYETFQ